MPFAGGLGPGLLFFLGLFCLGVVAHGAWLTQVATSVRRQPWPIGSKLTVVAVAALAPVVGPYGVLTYRWWHRLERVPPVAGPWSIALPLSGLGTVLFCAIAADWHYAAPYRSWSNAVGFLPGFLAAWLLTHAVIHSAAYVFGLSRRGPLLTRAHLVSSALMLAMVLALA